MSDLEDGAEILEHDNEKMNEVTEGEPTVKPSNNVSGNSTTATTGTTATTNVHSSASDSNTSANANSASTIPESAPDSTASNNNTIVPSNASSSNATTTSTPPGPPVLNKNTINNINKSLKAKQKIISSKEPHPKNTTLISDIMNESGQPTPPASSNQTELFSHQNSSSHSIDKETAPKKRKHKRIAKQASTRTDFFAAKLASAVDDVDSSDSNETFVYESQADEEEPKVPKMKKSVTQGPNMTFANPNSSVQSPTEELRVYERPESARAPSIAESYSSSYMEAPINRRLNTQRSFSSYACSEEQNDYIESTGGCSTGVGSIGIGSTGVGSTTGSVVASTGTESTGATHNQTANLTLNGNNDDNACGSAGENTSGTASGGGATGKTSSGSGAVSAFSGNAASGIASLNESGNDGNDTGTTSVPSVRNNIPVYNNFARRYDQYSIDEIDSDESGEEFDGECSKPAEPQRKSHTKSSTTSSKLRSTTSKLFDKIGSQPRRYSIIPDDIDIEDFDDELIYYDKNIRFPHSSQQPQGSPHENSPLLGQPRLAHYRSLNLNFPPGKRVKNRRYLSMPVHHASPPLEQNEYDNSYYYDYEDFDEEAHFSSKDGSTRYVSRHPSGLFIKKQKGRANCIKSFAYTLISVIIILAIGFVSGFVLASTKDLTDVAITAVENPVVSVDELVFNIVVRAVNPGWFSVDIVDVELDIFAKSGYIEDSATAMETVLLGTVYNLESPMSFGGGIFHRGPMDEEAEIKLLTPGKNLTGAASANETVPDNSKKWEAIIKNPFDLIIRGVLKYNLPISSTTKSVVVNRVGYIDPGQHRKVLDGIKEQGMDQDEDN